MLVIISFTGMFWPRLPQGSLYVEHPAAVSDRPYPIDNWHADVLNDLYVITADML